MRIKEEIIAAVVAVALLAWFGWSCWEVANNGILSAWNFWEVLF